MGALSAGVPLGNMLMVMPFAYILLNKPETYIHFVYRCEASFLDVPGADLAYQEQKSILILCYTVSHNLSDM